MPEVELAPASEQRQYVLSEQLKALGPVIEAQAEVEDHQVHAIRMMTEDTLGNDIRGADQDSAIEVVDGFVAARVRSLIAELGQELR